MWIESSKVVGLTAKPPAMCFVTMACGAGTEEWKLLDDADRVRRAVDEANAAHDGRRKENDGQQDRTTRDLLAGMVDCSARCCMCKRKTEELNEYGLCAVCTQALATLRQTQEVKQVEVTF
jgi:hypothetical protein